MVTKSIPGYRGVHRKEAPSPSPGSVKSMVFRGFHAPESMDLFFKYKYGGGHNTLLNVRDDRVYATLLVIRLCDLVDPLMVLDRFFNH